MSIDKIDQKDEQAEKDYTKQMMESSPAAKKAYEESLDERIAEISAAHGYDIESEAFEDPDINVRIHIKWQALSAAQNAHKNELNLADAKEVVKRFKIFLRSYQLFRVSNELPEINGSIYEITTAMQDKLGRICREIKHKERNDPKENWPNGLAESSTGLLLYLAMALENYDLDIEEGMLNELNEAVAQHGKK